MSGVGYVMFIYLILKIMIPGNLEILHTCAQWFLDIDFLGLFEF